MRAFDGEIHPRSPMFQLIFAVLFLFSAWGAWRHNPAYSRRSTLRTIAVLLLAIAGAIGLIVAAVNLTAGKSEAVIFSAAGAVIVIDTFALILIIQTFTVPKESKPTSLPHATKLVTTNRVKVIKWVKVFAIIIVVFAIPGVLIPGDIRFAPLTIAGFTAFLAIIFLPILYWTHRSLDQSLTAVEHDPWVHWQYTREQWTAWSNVQADRLKATPPTFVLKRDWHRLFWTIVGIAVGVYVFCPGSWLWKTLYIVIVCGAIATMVLLSGRGGASGAEKLRAKLLKANPEAYFGRDGIFCDGVFTSWLSGNNNLISATIDERQPRSAMFNFERYVPNPYGPTQTIAIHQAVLIPNGKESDLVRLQSELTARYPKARISLA
ncbi:MAG: hypothetical protein WA476_20605 [Acidobacteriaceae bacterium]